MLDLIQRDDTSTIPLEPRIGGQAHQIVDEAAPLAEPPRAKLLLIAEATPMRDRLERSLRRMPRLEAQIAVASTAAAAQFALANDDFDVVIIDGSVLVEIGKVATGDGSGSGVVMIAGNSGSRRDRRLPGLLEAAVVKAAINRSFVEFDA